MKDMIWEQEKKSLSPAREDEGFRKNSRLFMSGSLSNEGILGRGKIILKGTEA